MPGPSRFRKLRHLDPMMTIAALGLLGLGVVMVYSSSSLVGAEKFGDSAYFLKRHVLWMAVGLAGLCITFFMNPLAVRKISMPALITALLVLGLVALTGAGIQKKAATRWLSIGGFSFQPSEFVKPILIAFVASSIAKRGEKIKDFFHGLLPILATVGGVLVMILRQPDFGTTVLLAMVVMVMLFVGGAKIWHIGGLAALGGVAGFILMQSAGYRRQRLLAFMNPWQDPQGKGFQIIQSFIAFQHGGFQGQGLGDGTQKLLYLPEAHTDFIFSVIAEELGLMGSILVVLLFAVLVIQGLRLVLRLREPFTASLALGLTTMIGLQAVLHMAVVMGLVPTKGLTLPFISYGGSSLVVTMAAVGFLLSLSSTVSMVSSMARKREAR